jgi:hypothetical protein
MRRPVGERLDLRSVPEAAWERLAAKRIYFGHQSVGRNILAGAADLLRENPQIRVQVKDVADSGATGGALYHWQVGRNTDPASKLADFAGFMQEGGGERADIAFFKLCYVDIGPASNIDSLFAAYREEMTRLQQRYPRVLFVHVTVPLTVCQTGPRAWAKELLGRSRDGAEANLARNRFNDLLQQEFGKSGTVFDLARSESLRPDGSQEAFTNKGRRYLAMFPGYTTDGGHLNETGRRLVAADLLRFLANLDQVARR